MQIVSSGDKLHEMSNFVFWEKIRKYVMNLSSAELAKRVVKVKGLINNGSLKAILQIIVMLITKTHLFKYTENFTTTKYKFQIKNSNIFHISAQNIDCGYSLEPPRFRLSEAVLTSTHNLCFWAEIRKIMYTPVNPSFTI